MSLQVRNISKSYGNRTLFSHLSFSMEKGLLSLEGPSGCGKTTLMNILRKVEEADEGEVLHGEEDAASYAGAEPSLLYSLSLDENERLFHVVLDSERKKRLQDILSFDKNSTRLITLSGGERKKAELIHALAQKKTLYFLDEPFSSLDANSRSSLVPFLNELARESLVVLINHETDISGLEKNKVLLFEKDGLVCQDAKSSFPKEKENFDAKKRCALFPGILHYFRTQKFFSFCKSFLFLGFAVLFLMGMSWTDRKTNAENLAISLKADPFSYQAIDVSETEWNLPSSALSDNSGYPVLTLADRQTSKTLSLLGALEGGDTAYHVGAKDLITKEQTISLGSLTRTIEFVDEKRISDLVDIDAMFFQSIKDGYSDTEMLIIDKELFDHILTNDKGEICFGVDSLHLWEHSGMVYQNGELSFYQGSVAEIDFLPSDEYALAIPHIKKGETINTEFGEIKTTDETEGNKIAISLPLYRYLLLRHPDTSASVFSFSWYLPSDAILDLAFSSTPELSCYNIIKERRNTTKNIWYFSFAGLFLIAIPLFSLLSRKGKAFFSQSLALTYENNERKGAFLSLFLSNLLELLPPLLLSLPLYFCFFVPLANWQLMRLSYPIIPEGGTYYYSRQPFYPYYDGITKPLPFFQWDPLFLLIFLFFLSLAILNTTFLYQRGRKKT